MTMSNGFLSQEEIDSLLGGGDNKQSEVDAKDSSKEEVLSDIEKDLLGEIGNISMGSASTALYQLISQKVNITTPVVTSTTLNEIKDSFIAPTIVLDVKYTSGIVGRNILIIKTEDAAVIANLMMGGDGKPETHELSEMEISAVQEAMNQMIGSAATSMATMFSREVNISPPVAKIWKTNEEELSSEIAGDEKIVRVNFNMTIGDLVDSSIMQILPLPTAKKIVSIMMGNEEPEVKPPVVEQPKTIEQTPEPIYETPSPQVQNKPIVERPAPQVEVHEASFEPLKESRFSGSPKNIDLILDVPLDISVVLGRTKKSIKEILSLGTGSLIELEKLAEEPVEILVNGKKIAYGEVVVVDENFGVRITNIISNVERIKSLK
ncbi:Flagellar motor switch protein FliN [Clostridium vincentii]|uniref:Flagellar motor switch protein FliN n=2 Tax=Clostridium vincentii TaxID=52704 RepID=A0A2T0BG14_9CLOT|nr:Flagellar motor switch protein FliN [Clostridium vincentii]